MLSSFCYCCLCYCYWEDLRYLSSAPYALLVIPLFSFLCTKTLLKHLTHIYICICMYVCVRENMQNYNVRIRTTFIVVVLRECVSIRELSMKYDVLNETLIFCFIVHSSIIFANSQGLFCRTSVCCWWPIRLYIFKFHFNHNVTICAHRAYRQNKMKFRLWSFGFY